MAIQSSENLADNDSLSSAYDDNGYLMPLEIRNLKQSASQSHWRFVSYLQLNEQSHITSIPFKSNTLPGTSSKQKAASGKKKEVLDTIQIGCIPFPGGFSGLSSSHESEWDDCEELCGLCSFRRTSTENSPSLWHAVPLNPGRAPKLASSCRARAKTSQTTWKESSTSKILGKRIRGVEYGRYMLTISFQWQRQEAGMIRYRGLMTLGWERYS